MENLERWVSVEEIAEHLDVSSDTIYRWITDRALPAVKIGRRWKAKLSEVDAWARTGKAADSEQDLSGGQQ